VSTCQVIGKPETAPDIQILQHTAELADILIGRLWVSLFGYDAFAPPLAIIDGVVGRQLTHGLVADNALKAIDGPFAHRCAKFEAGRAKGP
jgi:hypothetical protein